MGARQVRQSNKIEFCPVCLKELTNRMSAMSHYRKHVRANEIENKADMFRISDTEIIGEKDNALYKAWWSRGFQMRDRFDIENPNTLRIARNDYLVRLFRLENGLKV